MSISFELYSIFRRIYHSIIVFIFWLYNRNKKKVVPCTENEILLQSATSLANQIKSRKIKSLKVVETFIERINEVNPLINALIDERFKEALEEAKQIDENLEKGTYSKEDLENLVFLGVPFTTKESCVCKGLSATFGLVCRKGMKGEEDAEVIAVMKSSGAILLGVCNVPELNMWVETYNLVFGATSNPYDTTKNVAGSTGGDGALIASLGVPVAVGTDIAGSVRGPSFRCGIFGHKPTNDLISTKGLCFRDGTEGPTIVTPGVMARKSEDLLPMLRVIVRNNPKLSLDKEVDVKKIRVLYTTTIECFLNGPIAKECKDAVMKCAKYFEGYSENKPRNVRIKCLDDALKLWFYAKTKEVGHFQKEIRNHTEEATFSREFWKYLRGVREHSVYTLFILYKLSSFRVFTEQKANRMMEDARNELINKLGDDGVLIMPSEPHPAGYHYSSLLEPSMYGFYSLFNILKFPATQVPIGLNSEGIPMGVQIVGTPFNDRLTIAVAKELEKAFGGHVQPIPK